MTRKAKLEKALAFDDTLQDISAHPEAFRQGRAAEMARLAQLHAALIEAVEALEFYKLEHEHWKHSPFEINRAKEALSKLDDALDSLQLGPDCKPTRDESGA